MGGSVKAAGAGLAAIALWINGTFGEVFYVLAVLLIIDAILNYADEGAYLQKLSWYSVTSGAAFYVQNASMSGIQVARGIMVLLAIHELTQVSLKLKERYQAFKDANPNEGPSSVVVAQDLDQLASLVAAKIQTPPSVLKEDPPTFAEGANGE